MKARPCKKQAISRTEDAAICLNAREQECVIQSCNSFGKPSPKQSSVFQEHGRWSEQLRHVSQQHNHFSHVRLKVAHHQDVKNGM